MDKIFRGQIDVGGGLGGGASANIGSTMKTNYQRNYNILHDYQ
jgi:hypothetical protein